VLHRNCKSVEDRNTHFLQLHTREHEKKFKGPLKFRQMYARSDKAQRYRCGVYELATHDNNSDHHNISTSSRCI
jgi:hypothetical protein